MRWIPAPKTALLHTLNNINFRPFFTDVTACEGCMTFRPIHFQPMQFQPLPFQPLTISTYGIYNRPQFQPKLILDI